MKFIKQRFAIKCCARGIASIFLLLLAVCGQAQAHQHQHKHNNKYLLETHDQVEQMRAAIMAKGRFADKFNQQKTYIDAKLMAPLNVPLPADAGGGYTHEVHKKNYADMLTAGRIFVLTQEPKYAQYVKRVLFAYADMYPSLPLHPKQKEQSPGKLFWQSLNEAVWLVYSIQAYDSIKGVLSDQEKMRIESNLFEPMVDYLSEQSPQTFNKIHNHGTWATAAVGMAGYVMDKPDWVEKSLYGLDKSGTGGFMRQLDELFSPQGYYNEGPYYQRYALMPFVLFAKAIEVNQPEREIFKHRDNILIKAINTTVQLSYNGLFFAINDAIKDKGIDTVELVHGVAIAYGITQETGLLSIVEKQNNILLTGYGLEVANALDANKKTAYPFASMSFGDGLKGDEGALLVFRQNQADDHQTLVFKATSQGLGHGHFDKLQWMFYNKGQEIVSDYGAARFLNIEAKYGGHYLPENNTYAKQTVAHNTLVVDQMSHFNGSTAKGNKYHPQVLFTQLDEHLNISSASMQNAYDDINFTRTQALVNTPEGKVFVLDILDVDALTNTKHVYDLPVHFNGQFIDSNVVLDSYTQQQRALGDNNGYQHLWLQSKGATTDDLVKVTWLKDRTFYTHTTVNSAAKTATNSSANTQDQSLLMTRIGANDPNFNLIANQALINRVSGANDHQFLSVLEVHGEYNPTQEFTLNSHSQLTSLANISDVIGLPNLNVFSVQFDGELEYLLVINKTDSQVTFDYKQKKHVITRKATLLRAN